MSDRGTIDHTWFRKVLGQYPTGVSVVTGIDPGEGPVGLVVGTFTSVSLDPPLVAFLPARTSTSWPKIEPTGRFCVNVLGADQEDVCRVFATTQPDKFRGLGWRPAGSGAPILDGAVAWVDCDVAAVHDAGDHVIVLGRVRDLGTESPALPLLFFQGGYGRFMPGAMASADAALAAELRLADQARPAMERIVADLGGRCHAMALVDDQIVVMAGAGDSGDRALRLIGERTPLFPVVGTAFMAFAPPDAVERWLDRAESPAAREDCRRRLEDVRRRGYSVGMKSPLHAEFERMWQEGAIAPAPDLLSEEARRVLRDLPYDPPGASLDAFEELRSLHVPVFGPGGGAPLVLNYFPPQQAERSRAGADRWLEVLRAASEGVTAVSS